MATWCFAVFCLLCHELFILYNALPPALDQLSMTEGLQTVSIINSPSLNLEVSGILSQQWQNNENTLPDVLILIKCLALLFQCLFPEYISEFLDHWLVLLNLLRCILSWRHPISPSIFMHSFADHITLGWKLVSFTAWNIHSKLLCSIKFVLRCLI